MTTLFGRRRDPGAARAQLADAQRSASGWRSTRSSRARPRTSSRSRWCAPRDALRDGGLATRLVLQIHDELLFEGPTEEVEQATEIVRREMVGAFELDPPLEVDVGVGENWLDAK